MYLKSGINYLFFSMWVHAFESSNEHVYKEGSVLQSSDECPQSGWECQVSLEGDNKLSNAVSNENDTGNESQITTSDSQGFESNKNISENESQLTEIEKSEYNLEETSLEDTKLLNPKEGLLKIRENYSILLWPEGIVPYYIDDKSYDDIINSRIRKAMDTIQNASCVLFRELDEPKYGSSREPWLHLTNPQKEKDCIHDTQINTSGETVLTLGFDCMRERDVIHVLMHALGFKDEVTHPQRDRYVRILWQNIQPRKQYLFRKQYLSPVNLVEYDTMSIMQFHDRAYSMNGAATMVPLIPGLIINPSNSLSLLDKMKLRLAYDKECNRRTVNNLIETCKTALCKSDKVTDSDFEGTLGEGESAVGNEYFSNNNVAENDEASLSNNGDNNVLK